jgi:hypothetical protein
MCHLSERKRRGLERPETVAHNSVFASLSEHRKAGNRGTPNQISGGYSSVGRAVALQAIGQGFESPYLHQRQVLMLGHKAHEAGGMFQRSMSAAAALHTFSDEEIAA